MSRAKICRFLPLDEIIILIDKRNFFVYTSVKSVFFLTDDIHHFLIKGRGEKSVEKNPQMIIRKKMCFFLRKE